MELVKRTSSLKIYSGAGGVLLLSGEAILDATRPSRRRELVDRCFSVPTLSTLRLATATLQLRFKPGRATLSETLEALGAAIRVSARGSLPLANAETVFAGFDGKALEIRRAGERLTFWRVEEAKPAFFRCYHPMLRQVGIRDRVLEDLSTLAYVEEESGSRWRADCITVRCRPQKMTADHLLDVLEPSLQRALQVREMPLVDFSPRRALINAHVVLAPVSDYLLPQFRGLSALLLAAINIRNVKRAISALRSGRVTLSVVHTWMGSLGLIALHFTGDAIMTWAMEHWPRRVAWLRRQSERRFLAHYRRYPRRVWVDRGGTQVELGLGDVKQGDRIFLRHGDIVPGDGVVVDGRGRVQESWITGEQDAVLKQDTDKLYASSRIVDGELLMRMTATGDGTIAARVASWYGRVFATPIPEESPAKKFADNTALPALVLSVATLNRGGIPMAKAVAHADYLTGPKLTNDLGDFASMLRSGFLGIHISSPDALTRIAEADCFVIDESAAAWRYHDGSGETLGERLKSLGVREVILVSNRTSDQAGRLTEAVGADLFHGGSGPSGIAAFVSQRGYYGRKVVYFGNVRENPAAAAAAYVSVAVETSLDRNLPDADVVLRQTDLEMCVTLRTMGLENIENQKIGLQTAYAFNLTCLGGALFLGFPILAVVALTNYGTFLSYVRAGSYLRAVEEDMKLKN